MYDPTVSLASSNATFSRFNLPSNVSAWVDACPSNVFASAAVTASKSFVFKILSSMPPPSFFRAVKLPSCAFASASETAAKSLPVPAEMSNASCCNSWASVTSFVLLTNRSSEGRKTSSVIPLANDVCVMYASVAAICALVAPVTFCNVLASLSCAASSAIAALTPSMSNLPA